MGASWKRSGLAKRRGLADAVMRLAPQSHLSSFSLSPLYHFIEGFLEMFFHNNKIQTLSGSCVLNRTHLSGRRCHENLFEVGGGGLVSVPFPLQAFPGIAA